MRRLAVLSSYVLAALLVSACRSQPASTPVPTAQPTPTDTQPQTKGVVVVALDGARSDWTSSQMRSAGMPNLAALAQRGVTVDRVQSSDPSLVATTYLALSTGAYPSQTGVVSDRYHAPQGTFDQAVEGQPQPLVQVESVWRTAMRSGLRTALLFWPSATRNVPELSGDYVVSAVSSDVPAAQRAVRLQDAEGWEGAPQSFSPLREGVLRVLGTDGGTAAAFYVLVADRTDDGAVNYDGLVLDSDKSLSNGHVLATLDKWAPATISPRLHSGAYFCLTACSNLTATIYTSRVCYNQAYPDDLLRSINVRHGFPPPVPDAEAFRAGWITPEQYYEMARRRAEWSTDVALYVYQSVRPDLMFTVQGIIGDCARAFLLTDLRQEGYTAEQAGLYASFMDKAYKVADDGLARLLGLVNLANRAFFVVSGQGLGPVHTAVRVNTILKNAGLLQVKVKDGRDVVDEAKSKALAFASGGSAHIYINLQGRERPGLVTPDDYLKVQNEIVQALQEARGDDGQPVFARVLKREELKSVHLDSPNSGDVFVQANPGYCLTDELGYRKAMLPARARAVGGFDSALPEMQGFLVAAGDGLVSGVTVPSMQAVDVAPTVGRALNLRLTETTPGRALDDIWR